MDERLKGALDKVHAEDALKEATMRALHRTAKGRAARTPAIRLIAVCASLLLLLVGGGTFYRIYAAPSAYIDMDINPSIELTVNRFGRVIDASAYNEEGVAVIRDVRVNRRGYEAAVAALLEAMIADGYVERDGLVSVTVQADDARREEELVNGVREAVSGALSSHHVKAAADVFAVTQEIKSCAYDHHISPAKYLAISELQAVDETATYENCADHSIRQIRKRTREHQSTHHEAAEAGAADQDTVSTDPQEDNTEAPGNRRKNHGRGHGGGGHH